jgi:hypothetical protein
MYSVYGEDPDGNSVSYGLDEGLPAYGSLVGNTFAFKPGYTVATTSVNVKFYVSDGVKISHFTYVLNVVNDAPTYSPDPVI